MYWCKKAEAAERSKSRTKSEGAVPVAPDSPKVTNIDEQVRTEANDAVASDSQVKSSLFIKRPHV